MAVAIREGIQDDEDALAALQNQIPFVVALGGESAEDAAVVRRLVAARLPNILHAPRRPDAFHALASLAYLAHQWIDFRVQHAIAIDIAINLVHVVAVVAQR